MTNVRSLTVAATAALLLVAGAGCAADSSSSGDPPSTTPSTSPPTSPDTSTTAPASESDAAAAAASSVVRKYFAVVDRLRQQPERSLIALKTVARSGELSAEQMLLRSERRKGLHQVGETRIAELKVQSINLDNSDPQSGTVPMAQVDVCWNVAEVDIVDQSGKSVVSPSRPDSGWIRFSAVNYHWATDPNGGWRVASSQDLEQKPCAAS
jgi:hypothetical protein